MIRGTRCITVDDLYHSGLVFCMDCLSAFLNIEIFLASLLKLISKGAEMLSFDIGESVRAFAGKIRSRD